jgi:hypothetical protein
MISYSSTAVYTMVNGADVDLQLCSRRCISTGDFTGDLARVAPSVLFGIFQKVIQQAGLAMTWGTLYTPVSTHVCTRRRTNMANQHSFMLSWTHLDGAIKIGPVGVFSRNKIGLHRTSRANFGCSSPDRCDSTDLRKEIRLVADGIS